MPSPMEFCCGGISTLSFDSGYATVDADYRFVVSSKVKEVFDNGNEYRRLHGKSLRLPLIAADRPDLLHLRWHNENRFVG